MRNTPEDYIEPKWEEYEKVHGWRNYVSDRIKRLWPTFTLQQQAALAENFQELANEEEMGLTE